MTRRAGGLNPFDPSTWLPKTGNPAIDRAIRQAAGRAGGAVLDALSPRAREAVEMVGGALRSRDAVVANPAEHPRIGGPPANGKDRFIGELLALQTGVIVILGRKGSGKTSLSLSLGQQYHERGRRVFVINIPQQQVGPLGFREVAAEDIERIPNGSVIVIDDTILSFDNRSYASDAAKALHKLLALARHKDQIVIANSQNSALLDRYLLEADVYFFKPSSAFSRERERKELLPLVQQADRELLRYDRDARKALVYVYSDVLEWQGLLRYSPPRGWSERLSKNKA